MTTRTRQVVLATITGPLVSLSPVDNGSGLSPYDVRDLARRAGADPKSTTRTTFIRLGELADLEAYAELRGVVVVRRRPP